MSRPSVHAEAVFELIESAPGPLSADEIRDGLRDTGIGIATVYRIVRSGSESGRLREVRMPTGPARYESGALAHHHHFECEACGRVLDFHGCPGNLDALAPAGAQVTSHEILLRGKCPDCVGAA